MNAVSAVGRWSIDSNRARETQQRYETRQPEGAIHRGTAPVADPRVGAPLAEPRTSHAASVTITSTKRSALKPCGYRLPPAARELVSMRPVDFPVPGEQSFRLVQQAAIRPYTLQCRQAKQLVNGFELTFRDCLPQCVRYSLHGNTFVP